MHKCLQIAKEMSRSKWVATRFLVGGVHHPVVQVIVRVGSAVKGVFPSLS